jgi:hypothetical protein
MAVERAEYVNQLDKEAPKGGDSISEGDDHLRVIKEAIVGSFPEIGSVVTATPAELNAVGDLLTDVEGLVTEVSEIKTELDALDKTAHGNVASCYWNPSFNPGDRLAYSHNVADVIVNPDDPSGMQTKVLFADGTMDGDPHYAFNLTPVNGTGQATNITVVGVANDHISFLAWHLVGEDWTAIPATELGFSLMVTDMQAGQ